MKSKKKKAPPPTAEQALNMSRPTSEPWATRYLEYARAHNRGPDVMLVWDRERFPGGKMAGFIIWINSRWGDWAKLKGLKRTGAGWEQPLSESRHAEFDGWLSKWVDQQTSVIIKPLPASVVVPK